MFKFILYKIGAFLVNAMSLNVAYNFGMFLSEMQYCFSPRDRKAVINNLRIIIGSEENLEEKAKEVFKNFGRYLVEFFRMRKMISPEFLKEKVVVKNLEILKNALTRGKGAILLTAHIGSFEMGGAVLNSLGYPMMAIALPHKERPVNDLFNHQREVTGTTIVPVQNSIRRCIERLRNNQVIALLADRDFTMNGEVLDFFGRKTLIPKGAAIFSCKTGAPIIPCFFLRQADNSFELIFLESIVPPGEYEGTIDETIIIELMKKYTKIIEKVIKENPTQWLMFREFWLK